MNLSFTSKVLFAVLLISTLLISCHKDSKTVEPEPAPQPIPVASGNLKLSFKNTVDLQDLVLGNTYTTSNGASYIVTKFNYYISNVVLTKSDNSEFVVPNIYRIVQQDKDTSRSILLKNIPVGTYTSVKFVLGIDSASNCSGAHSGGLDFNYAVDMFWGWNQGYIFLKFEGSAPTSTETNNRLEYHIGGYGGIYKTQKIYNIGFASTPALVSSSSSPELSVKVNVNEIFTNPSVINFATNAKQTSIGAGAKLIADNYADMITLDKVVN